VAFSFRLSFSVSFYESVADGAESSSPPGILSIVPGASSSVASPHGRRFAHAPGVAPAILLAATRLLVDAADTKADGRNSSDDGHGVFLSASILEHSPCQIKLLTIPHHFYVHMLQHRHTCVNLAVSNRHFWNTALLKI
jgi:hypothetical protein